MASLPPPPPPTKPQLDFVSAVNREMDRLVKSLDGLLKACHTDVSRANMSADRECLEMSTCAEIIVDATGRLLKLTAELRIAAALSNIPDNIREHDEYMTKMENETTSRTRALKRIKKEIEDSVVTLEEALE